PATIRLTGNAEAVGSNNGSVLQNNIIAKVTVLPDNGVGMGEQIVARLRVGIEHDVRQDSGVVPDRHVIANDSVSADMGVHSDAGRRWDSGSGMNARRIVR